MKFYIEVDKASISVIFNTFQTFGIDNLTNGKPVFINFTENLIMEEVLLEIKAPDIIKDALLHKN